jgi:hypothetical protein
MAGWMQIPRLERSHLAYAVADAFLQLIQSVGAQTQSGPALAAGPPLMEWKN